jgi:hypothetical protein
MRGIARLCGHPRYATPLALIRRAHSSKVSIGVGICRSRSASFETRRKKWLLICATLFTPATWLTLTSQGGDAVSVVTKATLSQDVGAPLTNLSLTFNGTPGLIADRELRRQALGEPGKFDDDPGVCASAYLLCFVHRPHAEIDVTTRRRGNFGKGGYTTADRGRPQVTDLNVRAHSALAGFEVRLDRIECRVFHGHDHDRSREHCRKRCILEPIGKVLRGHEQRERALSSCGDGAHGIPFFD